MIKHSFFKGLGRNVFLEEALKYRSPLFPVIRVQEFKSLDTREIRLQISDDRFTQIIVTANKLERVL